jgi:hypothetical protein
MRYLCLIYDDEKRLAARTAAEAEAMSADYAAFTEELKKKGHFVAGEALHRVSSATTVRVRNGSLLTTDGPFAETTEQLGGFYLIEARDLNEAMQVAARVPSAKVGSIEVRPIRGAGQGRRPDDP